MQGELAEGSGLDAVLHAVAFTLDDDGLGVAKDAVEDGRGESGNVVEDAGPVLEDLVGGEVMSSSTVPRWAMAAFGRAERCFLSPEKERPTNVAPIWMASAQ